LRHITPMLRQVSNETHGAHFCSYLRVDGARWEEFDFAEEAKFGATAFPRWDIPAERMKMKTPHIVPLSSQVVEVLRLLRMVTGDSEWLFPRSIAIALIALLTGAAYSQSTKFEVASVRESKPNADTTMNFRLGAGNIYGPTGGLFLTTNVPLIVYILFAYKIDEAYEMRALQHQLPAWAISTGFDIRARAESSNPTKDEMRQMMRALLAQRFKLTTHYETQQIPVFALVPLRPGKTGPSLRHHPATDKCSTTDSPMVSGPAPAVKSGPFPVTCGDIVGMLPSVPGRMHVGARDVTMGLIARSLNGMGMLGRPVLDRTGFGGTFDFALEFTPEIPNGVGPGESAADSTGPTFLSALTEQLGLKLTPQKGPVQMIIVDHVERPSEAEQ
jgi:uncharacterized protein (TIGR03435 family)